MGVLAKLRAKLRRPRENLADEYTAVGYKERVRRMKWQQRKQKAEKAGGAIKDFASGFLSGVGVKPTKKVSPKKGGKKLGRKLTKAVKNATKVSSRNTLEPPAWLPDFSAEAEPRRRKKRKSKGSDAIPWWLK